MIAVRLIAWVVLALVLGTAAGLALDAVAGTVWPRLAVGAIAVAVGARAALTARRNP